MATNLENFKSPRFTGEVIQADIEFFDSLQKIDRFATNNGLEIFVTQSVRKQVVPIGGAIVPPASRSNHLVGHAIDMNILLNGRLFNSTDLRASNLRNLPVGELSFRLSRLNCLVYYPLIIQNKKEYYFLLAHLCGERYSSFVICKGGMQL